MSDNLTEMWDATTPAEIFQEELHKVAGGVLGGDKAAIQKAIKVLLDLGNAALELEREALEIDAWLAEVPADNEMQHAIGNAQYFAYEHAYQAISKTLITN